MVPGIGTDTVITMIGLLEVPGGTLDDVSAAARKAISRLGVQASAVSKVKGLTTGEIVETTNLKDKETSFVKRIRHGPTLGTSQTNPRGEQVQHGIIQSDGNRKTIKCPHWGPSAGWYFRPGPT